MSLSSVDLWQRISAAGLASPMQCRSLAAEAAKSLSPSDSANGLLVLQELVTLGRLTKYQAKVLAGQADWPLERNGWAILDRVKNSVWNGWFKVTKIDLTKAEQPAPKWARWLTTDQLDELSKSAPSLQRALQLAQISDDSVQKCMVPELQQDQTLELLVAPIEGQLLSSTAATELSSAQVTRLIRSLASGLSSLHNKNLIHGRVFPDRISVEGPGYEKLKILIDPLCRIQAEPTNAFHGLLGTDLGNHLQTHFLAPEYLAPGQGPTKATDVYSLGCIWYWLLTGSPPIASDAIAAHAETSVDMDKIQLETPYLRCLKHCLGKNPKSRFPDANHLANALQECEKVIQRGKIQINTTHPQDLSNPTTPAAAPELLQQNVEKTVPPIAPEQATTASATPPTRKAIPDKKATTKDPVPTPEPVSPKKEKQLSKKPRSQGAHAGTSHKAEKAEPKKIAPAEAAPKSQAQSSQTQPAPEVEGTLLDEKETVAQTTEQHPPEEQKNETPDGNKNTHQKESAGEKENTDRTSLGAPKTRGGQTTAENQDTQPGKLIAAAAPVETPTPKSKITQPSQATKSAKRGRARNPSKTKRSRRKKKNNLLLPIGGACGFLVLLLGILKFSGALEPGETDEVSQNRPEYNPGNNSRPVPVAKDAREEYFNIQERDGIPWLPPNQPAPFSRELLPPGAQLLVSLRPSEIISTTQSKEVLAAFGPSGTFLTNALSELTKTEFAEIEHCVIGFYEPVSENQFPLLVARIKLIDPKPLSILKSHWKADGKKLVSESTLLVGEGDNAFYIEKQPLVDAQVVSEYSVGPLALMEEMVEFGGGTAPLNTQLNRLWQASDQQMMISILASPRFLFANGRGVFSEVPQRLAEILKENFGTDTRGVLVQTHFRESWYGELQVVPGSDQDAPRVSAAFANRLETLANDIESWFVDESPHPYWRALAIRFPQMLREFNNQTRSGVENGKAVLNFYMPATAAPNLLLAGWIASQDAATMAGSVSQATGQMEQPKELNVDEFLALKVDVSFDQEPIENALQLIGEDANGSIPQGSKPVQFLLDGDAFEKAGITRNQQLSNFNMSGRTLREALTEVAKRGNPVTTVTDTREADQRLIWVTVGEPVEKVMLTTRQAAGEAAINLPREFAPER